MIELVLAIAVVYAIVHVERLKGRALNFMSDGAKEIYESRGDLLIDVETYGERLRLLEADHPKLRTWIAEVMVATVPEPKRREIMKVLEKSYTRVELSSECSENDA